MTPSFQLYSARDHGPWDRTFERLAALGYRAVEGYSALHDEPEALARRLAGHGLAMPSSHVALDALENDTDAALAAARALGCKALYAPFLEPARRPTDLAGWRALAGRLDAVGRRLGAEGLAFGWHNHDFELEPLADGTVPLEVLLGDAPDIGWEADLAWVARAGADPAEWIARLGERVSAVHVKDVAPAGECADEDGWADPGHGTMDWDALMATLLGDGTERLYVAEHDAPADLDRFARRAAESLSRWTGAPR